MFNKLSRFAPALAILALLACVFGSAAYAQTDIASTITTIEGYWDSVVALAIGILLFVLGRRVVRKL